MEKYKEEIQGAVKSVYRALDILEAFLEYGPEVNLTELAYRLDMNKATVHRLLSTMEDRGYIQRSSGSKKYRLGSQVFDLGSYFQARLDIRRMALPFLLALSEQTGEAAFLCIREGDDALCIERVEAEQEVNIFSLRVGGKQPLHCGAAPRCLLAGMELVKIREYAERTNLPSFTQFSISEITQLITDVFQTIQQGYVFAREDVTIGVAAIGSPIRDYSGKVVAAVSIAGLVGRFTDEKLESIVHPVMKSAQQISIQMGFRTTV